MKKHICIIGILLNLFLNACSPAITPSNYEKEVEDAVKFEISELNYLIELIEYGAQNSLIVSWGLENWINGEMEKFDRLETKINEIYVKKQNATYKMVLSGLLQQAKGKKKYKEIEDATKRMLEIYRETSITLTNYEEIKNSTDKRIWKFKELNTGLVFTFTYDKKSESYSVESIEISAKNYMKQNLARARQNAINTNFKNNVEQLLNYFK